MSGTFSKIEVISGIARRRRLTIEQKLAVLDAGGCPLQHLRWGEGHACQAGPQVRKATWSSLPDPPPRVC